MRQPKIKKEYKTGEVIPAPRAQYTSMEIRPIFPYADPIILDIAEDAMKVFIARNTEEAETYLLGLIDALEADPIESWRGVGVIYLFVAGLGFKWSDRIRKKFRDLLSRFHFSYVQLPMHNKLEREFGNTHILDVIDALMRYEERAWGMRVRAVSSYLKWWTGIWGYNWAIGRINSDKDVVDRFNLDKELEIKRRPKHGRRKKKARKAKQTGTDSNPANPNSGVPGENNSTDQRFGPGQSGNIIPV